MQDEESLEVFRTSKDGTQIKSCCGAMADAKFLELFPSE